MADKIETRAGVDMTVPQLFVMKVPAHWPQAHVADIADRTTAILDEFHKGHRFLIICEGMEFDTVGTATLEELGLTKIDPDEDRTG